MNSAELKAYAKINVGLRITGQRGDGYHTLKTLFQTVSMHDVVKIELKNEPGVEFESKGEKVPDGEENLCVSAARIFLESISQSGGVSIFLDKKIPVGAGLGGGSSDAACVIRGLNDLLKIGLTGREMENIASEVGADVPFFIRGGCRYAEGIGDLLSPGNIPEDLCVLLAVPEIRIETSWAYNSLTHLSLTRDSEDVNLARFPHNGEATLKNGFRNDFEELVFSRYPEIGRLKELISRSGAVFTSLSGSGSAVYGFFESLTEAEKGKRALGGNPRSWVLRLIPAYTY